MCLKLFSKCRNYLYRLLFTSESRALLLGRLTLFSLICLTLYSWFRVYNIVYRRDNPSSSPSLSPFLSTTTQNYVITQRRYLPIGGIN